VAEEAQKCAKDEEWQAQWCADPGDKSLSLVQRVQQDLAKTQQCAEEARQRTTEGRQRAEDDVLRAEEEEAKQQRLREALEETMVQTSSSPKEAHTMIAAAISEQLGGGAHQTSTAKAWIGSSVHLALLNAHCRHGNVPGGWG
jgi:hypothetical protein